MSTSRGLLRECKTSCNLRESSFEALVRADLCDLLRGLPGLGVGLLAGVSAAGAGVAEAGAGELHVHGELEYRGYKRRLSKYH